MRIAVDYRGHRDMLQRRCLPQNIAAMNIVSRKHNDHGSEEQVRLLTRQAAAGAGAGSAEEHSLGAVCASVAVGCMGAFAFGYHLAVVNGPLEAIATDLGFAANKALQGLVRRGCGSTRATGLWSTWADYLTTWLACLLSSKAMAHDSNASII